MVVGVSAGFEKRMEMVGTGYRASTSGKELTLNVGYSKPRVLAVPEGVTVKVRERWDRQTHHHLVNKAGGVDVSKYTLKACKQ